MVYLLYLYINLLILDISEALKISELNSLEIINTNYATNSRLAQSYIDY